MSGLRLAHSPAGILVHRSTYIQKVLERFRFDKAYSLMTPMIARTKIPLLERGLYMYRANYTWSDIAFAINLLVR